MFKKNNIRAAVVLAAAAFTSLSTSAVAGGFQLTEQSALGLGRAYAGMGVDGTDVSGLYYNTASLTLHEGTQTQFGFVGVALDLDYQSQNGRNDNGRKKDAAVPNLFISHQVNDMTWLGFGFTVPFGLSTQYGKEWDQSGEGTDAKIEVYDFNPTVAFKLSDKLSIGGGVSYQYVKAQLGFNWSNHPVLGLTGQAGDSRARLSGDAWGWNIGMMWTPADNVRIGASYRSKVAHKVDGTLKTEGNINLPIQNAQGQITGTVKLPTTMKASVTMDAPAWALLSAAWDVNNTVSVYGAFRWANWSGFQKLTIDTPYTPLAADKKWKDTYLMTMGFDARVNEFWTYRAGIGYETSTISDAKVRGGTIPDADRWWFAMGSSFHWSKNFQADVGAAYLRGVHERAIYTHNARGEATKAGEFKKLDAYILGVQAQYRF